MDTKTMKRPSLIACYLLLFPILGGFYFSLMMVGQTDFGPIQIGQFEINEIEDLRPGGGPSLANLIEIPIATLGGAIGAIILFAFRLRRRFQTARSVFLFVTGFYIAAVIFYLAMPTLPE